MTKREREIDVTIEGVTIKPSTNHFGNDCPQLSQGFTHNLLTLSQFTELHLTALWCHFLLGTFATDAPILLHCSF